MAENTGILPQTVEKSVPPLIYALLSNALQVYGILVLGWHFFPILYMWWWEETVLSIFGLLKLRRLRPALLQRESKATVQEGEKTARGRFFLLFVYFVFVVVLGGFVLAPKGSYIENIITILFRNSIFNLNLLLLTGIQVWEFWRDFYRNPALDIRATEELRSTFDRRSMVIHIGLLAGALLSFLLQRYQLLHTEHAFMFGFMGIKTSVDLWMAWKGKKS